MKTLKLFSLLMFSLFFVNIVVAVPPVTTVFSGDTGINVEVNSMDVYKFNESRWQVIHLFNNTNGALITNTTNPNIYCTLHLRNSQGFEIGTLNATVHNDHWDINGSFGANNPIGVYVYTIECQDTGAKAGGYVSGYFEITPNGKPAPDGLVIMGFVLILLFILSYSVVLIIKALGHIIDKNFDLMDIGIMWGSYFALLGINQLASIYLGNVVVNDWLDLFVKLYAFPMMIVPVIAFFLSLFNMSKEKKRKEHQW